MPVFNSSYEARSAGWRDADGPPVRALLSLPVGALLSAKNDEKQNEPIDNDHQKAVSGKKQHGPDDKQGKTAGGHAGSRGQNSRGGNAGADGKSVGSHKPGGDGPGTKTFKHEHDLGDRKRSQ